jgi:hypothetical protein
LIYNIPHTSEILFRQGKYDRIKSIEHAIIKEIAVTRTRRSMIATELCPTKISNEIITPPSFSSFSTTSNGRSGIGSSRKTDRPTKLNQ